MLAYSWYGLLAPAATPQPVVDRLHQAVRDILVLPEVQAQLAANGATPPTLTARLCRPFTNLFCVQWPEQQAFYRGSVVVGRFL